MVFKGLFHLKSLYCIWAALKLDQCLKWEKKFSEHRTSVLLKALFFAISLLIDTSLKDRIGIVIEREADTKFLVSPGQKMPVE